MPNQPILKLLMPSSMTPENQPISPSLPRKLAIITRAANHTMVSQADFSPRMSSQVSTLVTSRMDSPSSATAVEFTLNSGPNSIAGIPAHRINSRPNTPIMIFSARSSAPMAVSCSRAKEVASGVRLSSGGYSTYSTAGIKAMATRPGNSAASAHWVQVIEMAESVALAIRSTIRGLGAVAVMNMAEVMGLA